MRPLSLIVALALGACTAVDGAPPEPLASAEPSQCFYASDVTTFRALDERTVYIATARGQTFRLDTLSDCNPVRNALSIGFSTPPGGDRVCDRARIDLIVADNRFPRRCPIRTLRRLDDAEIAALPDDVRP